MQQGGMVFSADCAGTTGHPLRKRWARAVPHTLHNNELETGCVVLNGRAETIRPHDYNELHPRLWLLSPGHREAESWARLSSSRCRGGRKQLEQEDEGGDGVVLTPQSLSTHIVLLEGA